MSDTIADDEIDLIELLEIVWSGKWFIAIVTGLVSVASLFGLMAMPTNYEMRMTIRPLSPQQMSAFAPLNNVPGVSPPIYAGEILVGYQGVITSNTLFDAVRADIISGRSMRAAIEALDPLFTDFKGTADERAEELIATARLFEQKNRRDNKDFELVTQTTDRDLTRRVFQQFVTNTSASIRRENLISISNLSKSIASSLDYEIENLRQEIDRQKTSYVEMTERRKANLAEQARIARAVGLENPLQVAQISNSVSTDDGPADTQVADDLYKRGYRALETELRLLKNRKPDSWTLFMPGYAEKAADLRKLESDKRLERIQSGLALTPLTDPENFRPAAFDLENISVTSADNKLYNLILIAFTTGLLSSIFILLRHTISQRKAATS